MPKINFKQLGNRSTCISWLSLIGEDILDQKLFIGVFLWEFQGKNPW